VNNNSFIKYCRNIFMSKPDEKLKPQGRRMRHYAPTKILILVGCWLLVIGTSTAQTPTIEERLAQMTLRQKIGQMFMVTFYGRPLNEPARTLIADWQPGFVALFPSNLGTPEQVTRLTNAIQETLIGAGAPPAFIAVDQEGGIIAHLKDGFTTFPVPMLITATQNPTLAYQYGAGIAAELRAVGINMNFAPVADLYTNRNNPIIGRRSFGSDPQQVNPILTAVIQGMQDSGVLATVKHFPGHGDTNEDSHTALPVIQDNREALLQQEFAPFAAAMAADVGMVMVAHIWYPALEPTENLPASLSPTIVTDILRAELQYTGLTMPDAMDMDAIDTVYSPAEAALLAVQAGQDVIVLGAHVSPQNHVAAMAAVLAAVEDGTIPEAQIDAAVRRILAAKERFGVFAWQPLDPATAAERVPLEQNAALLNEVFQAAVTVVYDDAALLPAAGDTAVIYFGAQPSLWQACNRREGLTPFAVSNTPSGGEISGAVWAAQQASKVIVFTQDAETNLQQQALIQALPLEKTVVVALESPFDLLSLPRPAAYVVTYSPLRPAYAAVCAVLFGDAPALGTLIVDLTPTN
jgi:beta-N-acetylhexosaminidase